MHLENNIRFLIAKSVLACVYCRSRRLDKEMDGWLEADVNGRSLSNYTTPVTARAGRGRTM